MSNKDFIEELRREFSGAVTKTEERFGQFFGEFDSSAASSIFGFCFQNKKGRFDFLEDLTAYDTEKEIIVVYNLYSTVLNYRIFLKTPLDRENPTIVSAQEHWKSAKYYELEVAEMFGVKFKNNALSAPFLLPANWEGFPMRKDYAYPKMFEGVEHKAATKVPAESREN